MNLRRTSNSRRAGRSLEFGCGTGRFAEELFETRLPSHAIYVGRDISKVMVRIARERMARYRSARDGRKIRWRRPNGLPERRLRQIYLHFRPGPPSRRRGASGHEGSASAVDRWRAGRSGQSNKRQTPIAWMITHIWNGLRAVSPMLVGGCRPIEILRLVPAPDWKIEYRNVVTPFGIPCEIVVARKTGASKGAS